MHKVDNIPKSGKQTSFGSQSREYYSVRDSHSSRTLFEEAVSIRLARPPHRAGGCPMPFMGDRVPYKLFYFFFEIVIPIKSGSPTQKDNVSSFTYLPGTLWLQQRNTYLTTKEFVPRLSVTVIAAPRANQNLSESAPTEHGRREVFPQNGPPLFTTNRKQRMECMPIFGVLNCQHVISLLSHSAKEISRVWH